MFWTVTRSLLQGCAQAGRLFFLTLLLGIPLGLPIALASMHTWAPFRRLVRGRKAPGRLSRWLAERRPVRDLAGLVVWAVRGTPLVLQLLIIFYGPGIWLGRNPWSAFPDGRMAACTLAFVLNYACYFSVIYRGGIQAVPQGQREAGEVLGLTARQIFFRVTLLQVVKRILPPMSNEVITLVKDTALARVIAVTEITMAGEAFMKSGGITWPLFYTGVFYLLFVGLLTALFHRLERRLDYFR